MNKTAEQDPRSNKHGHKRPYTELVTVDLGLNGINEKYHRNIRFVNMPFYPSRWLF
jgi:hypothetical protein